MGAAMVRAQGDKREWGDLDAEPEGDKREWGDLDAELLVEVLLYLPLRDRLQAMSVNKSWGRAVREGNVLWRKVKLRNKAWFGMYGIRKHTFPFKVLEVAEEVHFGYPFDNGTMMPLRGAIGSHFRVLELRGSYLCPSFFQDLSTDCPNLESLVVGDDPKGDHPIRICHPKLEVLEFRRSISHLLIVECPNLLVFRIGGSFPLHSLVHSLHCPRLTTLALSCDHYVEGGLSSMVSHSPNINRLEVILSAPNSFSDLTDFRSLTFLDFVGYNTSELIGWQWQWQLQWPHLEVLRFSLDTLMLNHVDVRHHGLRSLCVEEWGLVVDPVLNCPFLEHLELVGKYIGTQCLLNLHATCQQLKKLDMVRHLFKMESLRNPAPVGPIELRHETLEEVKLETIGDGDVGSLIFSEVKCTNLTKLHIRGEFGLSCLPSLVSNFPTLLSLELSGVHMGWSNVVIELSHVQHFVLERSTILSLSLNMTSLLRGSIDMSFVRVLRVRHRQEGLMEFTCVRVGESEVRKLVRGGKMVGINLSYDELCTLKVV